MAKSIRIIDLWIYINNKTFFTAQELADEFNVSLRTIKRDLDELSVLGVPFYSEVGRNGGYKMLHNDFLPPISFSFSEVLSILITYETLNQYIDNPFNIESEKVQEKIFMQLPKEKRAKANIIKEYLVMWQGNSPYKANYIEDILTAAINKNEIEIIYESSNKQSKKRVVPLGLFGNNNNWYFPGFDQQSNEIKMYRCDRVVNLNILASVLVDVVSLKDWLSEEYQFKDGIRVKLWLTRKGCFELTDFFKIPIAEIEQDKMIYHEDVIRKSDIDYFVKHCLRLGKEVVVIEPLEAIEKMKAELEEINAFFNENY